MPPAAFASLDAAERWCTDWLTSAALPLWAGAGVDPANGGFREALTVEGAPHDPRRRIRVQARQIFVFAAAAAEGLGPSYADLARRGLAFLMRARRPDGLFANVLSPTGEVVDERVRLYEHAFVLLALSAMHRIEPQADHAATAAQVRGALAALRHPAGGFREEGGQPFQANAHMHVLEAALAWEALSDEPGWARLADDVAGLALSQFITPGSGALQEFFAADWRPVTGEAGAIEPGHQFEWAWLLDTWGTGRGEAGARAAARRLFEVGLNGLDPDRGVVVNRLHDDLTIRDAAARLWPQGEFLRACLALDAAPQALRAATALVRFLDTPAPGAWRERMAANGAFVEEPAPATSLYHLASAMLALRARVCG